MTPQELRRDETLRWLSAAAKDLKVAGLLTTEEPTGSVFHSQQAAEKSAKAFLTFHGVPFRKTHDLQELGKQCGALNGSLGSLMAEADYLTDYAALFRYRTRRANLTPTKRKRPWRRLAAFTNRCRFSSNFSSN